MVPFSIGNRQSKIGNAFRLARILQMVRPARLLVLCLLLLPVIALAQDYDSAAEQELFKLVNQERARAGLSALKWDDRMQQAAREHTRRMVAARRLSHDFPGEQSLPKRLAATGLRLNNDGENVSYDYSVAAAHKGLMNSPPHRANILRPQFNAGGIGVVRSGDQLWITEDFAHKVETLSENDARNMVIAGFERLRGESRHPPARVVNAPRLRELACNMAKQDKLDMDAALALPNVRSAVAYTESEPQHLPSSAHRLASDASITGFAAGLCFAASAKYPSGVYWVVMTFY
jgi:Cysteine-rich secretory protein family